MLEKPDIADAQIIDHLKTRYDLNIVQFDLLPLGADWNTAVYCAIAVDGQYFVKLRRGHFDETAVVVPQLLYERGVEQVIAAIPTLLGELWAQLDVFAVILYPFVEGKNGFEQALTDQNWIVFGRALKGIHAINLPPDVVSHLPRETFSSFWRMKVKGFQTHVAEVPFADPIAAEFAAFMNQKQNAITSLVRYADHFASVLQNRTLPFILCHADIHVGNLLLTPNHSLYVVDWDTLTLAPKERDLMFVGMGMGSTRYTADEQTTFFYQGYGHIDIDRMALAYYRCERIVQDVFAYCEEILFSGGNDTDRRQGLRHFQSQFQADAVVERAFKSVDELPSF